MVATEHMVQGSSHADDAFHSDYHSYAYFSLDLGYVAQLVDFSEPRPKEAVDVGMQQHMGLNSTPCEPEVLGIENEPEEQPLMGTYEQSALGQDYPFDQMSDHVELQMEHKVPQGKYMEVQQQWKLMLQDKQKALQGDILDTDMAQQDGP